MFQIKSFFGCELSTGAKVIGVVGVIKHFLSFLLYFFVIYFTWIIVEDQTKISNKEENLVLYAMEIVFDTIIAVLIFLELLNILLCYRLYKPRRDKFLEELSNWVFLTKVYLVVGVLGLVRQIMKEEYYAVPLALSLLFDFYCFICITSLKKQVKEGSALLPTRN